jgi:anti-anti-sigma factor
MTFELRTAATSAASIPAVEIRGDVDAANAASLQAALADLASSALIIDLSAVSYFDSAGFALIDLLLSRARLAVVIAPGSVLRTAAQLMKIPFHDTVDDARAALRPA